MLVEGKYSKLARWKQRSILVFRSQLFAFFCSVLFVFMAHESTRPLLATDIVGTVFVLVCGLGLAFLIRAAILKNGTLLMRISMALEALYVLVLLYGGVFLNVSTRGSSNFHPNTFWIFPLLSLLGCVTHLWAVVIAIQVQQVLEKNK
jgi:hypothetical protein